MTRRQSIALLVFVMVLSALGSALFACVAAPGDPLNGCPRTSKDGIDWAPNPSAFCVGEDAFFRAFKYNRTTATCTLEPASSLDMDYYMGSPVYENVVYKWSFALQSDPTQVTQWDGPSAYHVFTEPGVYIVTLTVRDIGDATGKRYYDDPDVTEVRIITVADCPGPVIYVSEKDGDDTKAGWSWWSAKKTIKAAMDIALTGPSPDDGKEIWVAAGTYTEKVAMKSGVGLYGGFRGDEKRREERDWTKNPTTLTFENDNIVSVPDRALPSTIVSGFTIEGGKGVERGGGISCGADSSPVICNNYIKGNGASLDGAGIYCYNSTALIHDNIIAGNSAVGLGGAIACDGGSPKIINNTIVDNNSEVDGGAIYVSDGAKIANNIIAYNSSGICSDSTSGVDLLTNCLHQNREQGEEIDRHYIGLLAGETDIFFPPLFVNKLGPDYTLNQFSECIDRGTDSAAGSLWTDMSHKLRRAGDRVDIGAYEYGSRYVQIGDCKLYVSPDNDLLSVRQSGGICQPSTAEYTLYNEGPGTMSWEVTKPASPWISISPATSGILVAGADVTLTVSINSADPGIAGAGSYLTPLTFTNKTSHVGDTTRNVGIEAAGSYAGLVVTPDAGGNSSGSIGGPFAPTSFAYTLENTNGIAMNWAVSSDQNWITVDPAQGTMAAHSTQTVTLTINERAKSLDAGIHFAVISFQNTDNGVGNTTRTISLTVRGTGGPKIAVVEPENVDVVWPLPPNASKIYHVDNVGSSGGLDICVPSRFPTLNANGSDIRGDYFPTRYTPIAPFTVLLDPGTNPSPGVYAGSIDFQNGVDFMWEAPWQMFTEDSRKMRIVVPSTSGAYLAVEEYADLNFVRRGGAYDVISGTNTITNCGNAAMDWTASADQSWVWLSGQAGRLQPGESTVIEVGIRADATVAEGFTSATVTFANTTNGQGNTTRGVCLETELYYASRRTDVSAGNLQASGPVGGPFDPTTATYTVTNPQTSNVGYDFQRGSADWVYVWGWQPDWPVVWSMGGILEPNMSDSVDVEINERAGNLAPGRHQNLVVVRDDYGFAQTTRIVDLVVKGSGYVPPSVLPETDFIGAPDSAPTTYSVTNCSGDQSITVTASSSQTWLTVSPQSCTLAPGASQDVTVTIASTDPALQLPGLHKGVISFGDSTLSLITTRVMRIVTEPSSDGLIAVDEAENFTASGTYGGSFYPASKTYTLVGCSDGPSMSSVTNWQVEASEPWVTISPSTGILPKDKMVGVKISLAPEVKELAVGTHSCVVTFRDLTSGQVDATRTVNVTVQPGIGSLTVSPINDWNASLSVKGEPLGEMKRNFVLQNLTGVSVNWRVTKLAPWLSLSTPADGTLVSGAKSQVMASIVTTDALCKEAGKHTDAIIIEDLTNHTSIRVPVCLTVEKYTGDLVVSPENGLEASGASASSAITDSSICYQLTNKGNKNIIWSLTQRLPENAPEDATMDWLNVSLPASFELAPGQGQTADVNVSINEAATKLMDTGTYTIFLDFYNKTTGSGDTSRTITLTLNGKGNPQLTMDDEDDLTVCGPVGGPFYSTDPLDPTPSKTYTVRNTGAYDVACLLASTVSWVTMEPAESVVVPANGSATVKVSLNSEAVTTLNTAGKLYTGKLTFTNAWTRSQTITKYVHGLVVTSGAGPIAVEEDDNFVVSASDGAYSPSSEKEYHLWNLGDEPLEWRASTSIPWVTLSDNDSAATGPLEPAKAGKSQTITVKIVKNDPRIAATGVYPATGQPNTVLFENLSVEGTTDDKTRTVRLTVNNASGFDVTPTAGLTASSADPAVYPTFPTGGDYFTLTNTNPTTLPWTAALDQPADTPWIRWWPNSNLYTLPANGTDKAYVALTGNFRLGPKAATIVFTAGNGGVKKRDVLVKVNDLPGTPGLLSVIERDGFDSAGLQGGSFYPMSKTYTVFNAGGSTLTWTATSDVSWLTLSPAGNHQLASGSTATLTVTLNPSSLAPGVYPDNPTTPVIHFSNVTNPANVTDKTNRTARVIVTGTTGGLVVSGARADSLISAGKMGGPFVPDSNEYTLYNCGTSTITWSANSAQEWTSASPYSGALRSGANAKVKVYLNSFAGELLPGHYVGSVDFRDLTKNTGPAKAVDLLVSGSTANKIVCVSPEGDDSNEGLNWDTPKKTIREAIKAARNPGGEVWVKGGYYQGPITIPAYVYVRGGFIGRGALRDWRTNPSIIDGLVLGSVVTFDNGGTNCSAFDGFIIYNGAGHDDANGRYGGGIYCENSSPTILHNIILGNVLSGGGNAYGAGVYIKNAKAPTLVSNAITGNTASGSSGKGGGLYCLNAAPKLYNNTISYNTAQDGGGVYFDNSSAAVTNSLVSENTSGVYVVGDIAPTFTCDDVIGNSYNNGPGVPSYEFAGIDPPTGDGNLGEDPNLIEETLFGVKVKIRIQASSTCINKGTNSVAADGDLDLDGRDRKLGGVADIGACEGLACYPTTVYLTAEKQRVRTGSAIRVTAKVYDPYSLQFEPGWEVRFDAPGAVVTLPNGSITDAQGSVVADIRSSQDATIPVIAKIKTCNKWLMSPAVDLSFVSGGNWPMFMHDAQHTGLADDTGLVPSRMDEMWSASVPTSTASGQVLSSSPHPRRGNEWILKHPVFDSSPVVVDNYLVIGCWTSENRGEVKCYNAETGALRWSQNDGGLMGGVASTPCIRGDYVYVGSANGYLYCLKLTSGEWNGEQKNGGDILSRALTTNRSGANGIVYSSPVAYNGRVYIGNEAGKVYGFVDDGHLSQLFEKRLPVDQYGSDAQNTMGTTSPAVVTISGSGTIPDHDCVVIGCDDGNLYRLDMSNPADPSLSSTDLGAIVESSPSIAGNSAFAASLGWGGNHIFKVGVDSWLVQAKASCRGEVRTVPSLGFDSVYFGDEYNDCIHRMTQSTLDNHVVSATQTSIIGSAAIDPSGVGFVGDTRGSLWQFGAVSMTREAQLNLGGPIYSTPAISHRVDAEGNMWLFVTSRENGGKLRAYRSRNSSTILAPPTITPDSGLFYEAPQTVVLSCASGASIIYTTGNGDPTPANGTTCESGTTLTLGVNTTIKAIAIKGTQTSGITTAAIHFAVPALDFDPAGNTPLYESSTPVSITCGAQYADIYYTLNGDPPTIYSTHYVETNKPVITATQNKLQAVALRSYWDSSPVKSVTYKVTGRILQPVYSPAGGTYPTSKTVTITAGTNQASTPAGIKIRYTTDPNDTPTTTNGTEIINGGTVLISQSCNLKAIAYLQDWDTSPLQSKNFTINGAVPTPTFNPEPGDEPASSHLSIKIVCEQPFDTIRYATGPMGTTVDPPTSTTGTAYTYGDPIDITESTTIVAVAFKGGLADSQPATATYELKLPAPVFDPPAPMTFTQSPQLVKITCSEPNSKIIYTTDPALIPSDDPRVGTEIDTDAVIQLTGTSTLKAIATKPNWTTSDLKSGDYEFDFQLAAPAFSPSGGLQTAPSITVTMYSASADRITYTTDNTEPLVNGMIYSTGLPVSATTSFKAKAWQISAGGQVTASSKTSAAEFVFGTNVVSALPDIPTPGWAQDIVAVDEPAAGGQGPSSADAVCLGSGVYENRPGADIAVKNPTGPDVAYTRVYRSALVEQAQRNCAPGLSIGWVDNFYVTATGSQSWAPITLTYPNGATDTLTPVLDGTVPTGRFTSSAAGAAAFEAIGEPNTGDPGRWQSISLKFEDGSSWTLTPEAPSRLDDYVLTQIGDVVGYPVTIQRDQTDERRNWISNIYGTGPNGSYPLLQFSYNYGTGQLQSISGDGRSVSYEFGTLQDIGWSVLTGVSQVNNSSSLRWKYEYTSQSGLPYICKVEAPDSSGTVGSTLHSIVYSSNPGQKSVRALIDANGNTRVYGYGGASHLTRVSVFDSLGNLVEWWVQKLGAQFYENTGIIDDANNSTSVGYTNSQPTDYTDENGRPTHIEYYPDGTGRIHTITQRMDTGEGLDFVPAYLVTTYTYDNAHPDRLVKVQTGDKTATEYTYYPDGNPAAGKLWQIKTPKPGTVGTGETVVTEYGYTALGNIRYICRPGPNDSGVPIYSFFWYEYDPFDDDWSNYFYGEELGEPLAVSVHEGYPLDINGDLLPNPKLISTVSYRYDEHRRISAVIDGLKDIYRTGNATHYFYNDADQVTRIEYPLHKAPSQTRNSVDKQSVTDLVYCYPGGPLKSVGIKDYYDDEYLRYFEVTPGRETEVKNQFGSVPSVSYDYGPDYKINGVTNAKGNKTGIGYNRAGRLDTLQRPIGKPAYFEYDAAGNITLQRVGNDTTLMSRSPESGQVKMVQKGSQPADFYTYDVYGRVVKSNNNLYATLEYSYDDNDSLLSATTMYPPDKAGPIGGTIGYSYYPDGSRKSMTVPASSWFDNKTTYSYSYAYDAANKQYRHMVSGPWTGANVTYWYDVRGKLTQVSQTSSPSDSKTAHYTLYSYDAAGFLTSLTNRNGTTDLSGAIDASRFERMWHDAAGNLVFMSSYYDDMSSVQLHFPKMGGDTYYEYDGQNRLTREQRWIGYKISGTLLYDSSYAYDAVGNPTTIASKTIGDYNPNNELPSPLGVFNNIGNPTTLGNYTLQYQVAGAAPADDPARPASISGTADASLPPLDMVIRYRPDGKPASKTQGTSKTYYLYDGDRAICEMRPEGYLELLKLYGPNGLFASCTGGNEAKNRKRVIYAYDPSGSLANSYAHLSLMPYDTAAVYDTQGNRQCSVNVQGASFDFCGYKGQAGFCTEQVVAKGTMRALGLLVSCGDYIYDPQTGWVTGDKLLLTARDGLDLLGTIPALGAIPDIGSAAISFAAGDWKRGFTSVGSIVVPGLSAAVYKGAKGIYNSVKVADRVEHVFIAAERGEIAASKISHVAAEEVSAAVDYSRPSGYRKGIREAVWNNAKGADGVVRDPLTGREMAFDDRWDMGHEPGHEFRKHQQSAMDRGISRKEFLNEHNNPANYRPELPSSNRSHAGELPDGIYLGP